MNIYIRKLKEDDAKIAYKWRNNPNIWKFSTPKWNRVITYEIERDWIREVTKKEDEKRFAICIEGTNEYIGNVQLTKINQFDAEFHIFIGEEKYWGKGIASKACQLILEFARKELTIKQVYLYVYKNNLYAIKAYKKNGFIITDDSKDFIKMTIYL